MLENFVRERERNKGDQASLFDPQSFVDWNSSSQGLKFIYSMRATRTKKK